jgi:hypothetical protein
MNLTTRFDGRICLVSLALRAELIGALVSDFVMLIKTQTFKEEFLPSQ